MKIIRRNYLGETKKGATERRLHAVETHLNDLEVRLNTNFYNHLKEFHPNQDAYTPEEKRLYNPEEG
jgi:hypothetical protein